MLRLNFRRSYFSAFSLFSSRRSERGLSGARRAGLVLSLVCVCWLAGIPLNTSAQTVKTGTLAYLKQCNGFGNLRLGTDIGEISRFQFDYLDNDSRADQDSCFKFAYKDNDILKIDSNFSLNLVGVRTFKNHIINIYLFFDRQDGYKVLNYFMATYGMFTNRPNSYKDIYQWDTSQLSVSLLYAANTDMGVAVFTYHPAEKQIAGRQEKVAEDQKEGQRKALLYASQ